MCSVCMESSTDFSSFTFITWTTAGMWPRKERNVEKAARKKKSGFSFIFTQDGDLDGWLLFDMFLCDEMQEKENLSLEYQIQPRFPSW